MCKYGSICERQYCKYKHRKEEESIESEFDQTVVEESNLEEKQEESVEDITVKYTNDRHEECESIVIVDVETVNLGVQKKSENDETIEQDEFKEANADNMSNKHDDIEVVNVEVVNVKIVDVRDETIENPYSDSDAITKASDKNSDIGKKQIPEKLLVVLFAKYVMLKLKTNMIL